MDASFGRITTLGATHCGVHDIDLIEAGDGRAEASRRLQRIVERPGGQAERIEARRFERAGLEHLSGGRQ
ncbi:uncharacterized protein SOCEGT47_013890 [Sorangium cellulosum]|uniref:Uncharacterized protein n=1 Tax=Sorangium cellulosum TaxID=56 RepID=A0A4P2PWS3_SORCE|nr:hypothetical protein [Sorangium cellulosum]AUX20913.1 uncharacterized protein SOCEGT47_013890 [Sorangium cellulosum]